MTPEFIIQRWTNGSWFYVGVISGEEQAKAAVNGLNAAGTWEYRYVP